MLGRQGWLVDRRIAPHIPLHDASERDDGAFSRSAAVSGRDCDLWTHPQRLSPPFAKLPHVGSHQANIPKTFAENKTGAPKMSSSFG